jgi:hypothetical protein
MKVQIKSTIWITERYPKVGTASYDPPTRLFFEKHKDHVGWIDIADLIEAKEIFLTERKQWK